MTVEEILRHHVSVGGTHWDRERQTTFTRCRCGVKCYILEQPDHAAHVADLLKNLPSETPRLDFAVHVVRRWTVDLAVDAVRWFR